MTEGRSSFVDDARDVVDSVTSGVVDVGSSAAAGVAQTHAAADHAIRSTASAARHASHNVMTTAASGASDIAVTYSDVTAMRTTLGSLSRHATRLAGRALSTTVNPELVESLVLSPVTGATAVASLTGASAALGAFGLGIEVLGVSVGAVVTTYSIADATLSNSAAVLSGVFTATGTGLVGAGGVVVTGTSALGRTGWTTLTAGADVLQESLQLAVEAGRAAVAGAVVVNSLVFLAVSTAGLTLAENVAESANHIVTDPFNTATYQDLGYVWSDAGHEAMLNAGRSIGTLPDAVYEDTIANLVFLFDKAGFHDEAHLVDGSVVSEKELLDRHVDFTQRVPRDWRESFTEPSDLPDLFYSMGDVDALGDKDQAVIRVLIKASEPPAFTLIIPSTKSWNPGSNIPNDIIGNLHVMTGDSRLVQTARDALDRAMATAGVTDTSSVPVMVAGFSQGGIAAGAFAEQFQDDYTIEQVVTIGAPVGNFTRIPAHTQVVSYEYSDDVVPLLDGAENPATWETIKVEGGKHDAIEYAQAARDDTPSKPNDIDLFLNDGTGGLDVKDYYATRGRK